MICNECETVAHCLKNGCVPKQQPAPVQVLQRYSPDGAGAMEADSLGAYVKHQDAIIAPPAQPAPVQQSRSDVEPVGTYGEIYESMQALLRTGLQRDQQIYMAMKDKPLYATPPSDEIQRLSALVRAQQITIDKLEALLKEKNCD